MSTQAFKPVRMLERALPALAWFKHYARADLQADLVAGLVTAILLVPQAMAYAMLAGLPPQVGLYASVAAPLAYALFGSSRTLSVGPVSVSAIMVAAALAAAGLQREGANVANALVLALECGVVLLVMAAVRLGVIVNFLSHPVLSGFTSGAAVIIVLTQVPPLLGVASIQSTAGYDLVAAIFRELHSTRPATLLLGAVSVFLLALAGGPFKTALRGLGAGRWAAALDRAGPLLVVLLATLAIVALDLDRAQRVVTVGAIPAGMPRPDWGFLRLDTWLKLFPSAVLIAFIGYIESVSIAKLLASRRRERISANQELAALGTANVAAAFTNGLPVAGGFGRTMVNFAAGARTQVAGVVTALLIGLTLLAFAPWFARVPRAALAAIIVVAVVRLIDVATVRALWRYQRSDAVVLLLTLASVLILGIEAGLVIGVVMSLLFYVWRASRPHMAVVGRIPGTEHFRNVLRHRVETWPRLALIRVDESLSFANIGVVEDFIMGYLASHRNVEHLVLIGSAINHIDGSALDALERLFAGLRDAGVTVHFAEIKGPVLDALERVDLPARMAPGRIFFRTTEAVQALAVK